MKSLRSMSLPFLALLLTLTLSLSGCHGYDNSQQISDLQERVTELENQLETAQAQLTNQGSTVNNPATTLPPNDISNETEPNDPNNAATSPDPATSSYIDEQLKSDNYEAWLSAAGCPSATSEQLLLAAQRCASINSSSDYDYAIAIAYALATNPSIDGEALAALGNSPYPDIVMIAAESNYADSYALTHLAKRCVAIGAYYDGDYIAALICQHPNATDEVIATLSESEYSEILIIAASSPYAGETALTRLAERCASLSAYSDSAYDLATAICSNPNATATSLQPLASAYYGDVSKIGHDAIVALTP